LTDAERSQRDLFEHLKDCDPKLQLSVKKTKEDMYLQFFVELVSDSFTDVNMKKLMREKIKEKAQMRIEE